MQLQSTLIVSRECTDLGLRAAAIIFRGVRISDAPAELRSQITDQVEAIRRQFSTLAEVRATPELVQFRQILRSVGVNPRKLLPSVESLYRLILKRGALPVINNLVDAYNLVSARSRCSMGAHDLDRITTPVALRLLRGDEDFTPLGTDQVQKATPGEFGYVDAKNHLLCRLDVLQAEFSKVTMRTRNVLMIIEATTAHNPEQILRARADTIALVQHLCGGQAEIVSFPYNSGGLSVRSNE